MSGMNGDQLHGSTLGIYSSLMDEFNPSLQKLVALGNSYAQAFHTLALTSEAYFNALSKIGERAFHTVSSNSIGDVLIQISESQRRLTLELEGVFRWFSVDVLQVMDNNISQDKGYISDSRKRYEMQVHTQASALERRPGRAYNQDYGEYVQFLRESHSDALKEEERRYRYLAEKHCDLAQSFSQLMNKTGGSLQQKVDSWRREVDATRGPDVGQPVAPDNSARLREEIKRSMEEQPLGNVPSRAPSPQGSVFRLSVESGGGGRRSMRARAAHQPAGSNPTMLPFARGETITLLVQQPKNGWLYGRADSSGRQGWFPAAYVEEVDDLPPFADYGGRSGSSSSSQSGGQPPPPPPPPPSFDRLSEPKAATATVEKRSDANPENKRSASHGSRPELFPKGTNPFATVKLKPTSTNDRSGPRLHR